MERPKTFEAFLDEARKLVDGADTSRMAQCSSCGEPYIAVFSELTGNHCLGCAREIFYGDSRGAVEEVFAMNCAVADRRQRAFDSQVFGQRYGRGQTSS